MKLLKPLPIGVGIVVNNTEEFDAVWNGAIISGRAPVIENKQQVLDQFERSNFKMAFYMPFMNFSDRRDHQPLNWASVECLKLNDIEIENAASFFSIDPLRESLRHVIMTHTTRLEMMKLNRSKWEEEQHTDAQMEHDEQMIKSLADVLSDLNKLL